MYLIQGVFFQVRTGLGSSWKSGDLIATIGMAFSWFGFSGIIGDTRDGQSISAMKDHFGDSELLDFSLTPTELRFKKRYSNDSTVWNYRFTLQPDGTWSGEYESDPRGARGFARCILTQVADGFLEPPEKEIKLAQKQMRKFLKSPDNLL